MWWRTALAAPTVVLLVACSGAPDPGRAPAAVPAGAPPPSTASASSSATIAYTRAEARRLDPRRDDPNGCPVRHAQRPQARSSPETVSVCGYRHGVIVTSERLTGANATGAMAAIRRAPRRAATVCPLARIPVPAIELITPRGTATLVWQRCTGLDWRSVRREITAEVLYWALSPGNRMRLPGRVASPADMLGFRRH